MKHLIKFVVLFVSLHLASFSAMALENTHVNIRVLSVEAATSMAMAAYKDCTAKGYQVTVAVVGRDGLLLNLMRNPLAGAHTIEVARAKAWTAASTKTATTRLMGQSFMRDIPGALIIGGGLPVNIGGHFYGAIGVSGAPAKKTPGDVDDECALVGIAMIQDDLEMAE